MVYSALLWVGVSRPSLFRKKAGESTLAAYGSFTIIPTIVFALSGCGNLNIYSIHFWMKAVRKTMTLSPEPSTL